MEGIMSDESLEEDGVEDDDVCVDCGERIEQCLCDEDWDDEEEMDDDDEIEDDEDPEMEDWAED